MYNKILLGLTVIAALALMLGGFVTVAPNRLVTGQPIGLASAPAGWPGAGLALLVGLLALASVLRPSRRASMLIGLLAASLIVADVAAAGRAAAVLGLGRPAAFRVGLGSGFWVVLLAAALAVVDALQRLGAGAALRFATLAAVTLALLGLAETGSVAALSLAREFDQHRAVFYAELGRHLGLVVAALVPTLVIGAPLGVLAQRHPRFGRPLLAGLGIVQTIPSIALFGLMIAPLAALGFGGVGMVPAVIGLIAYALLPVVRNTEAGLAGVDPALLDSARGMGMSAGQIFRQIELPMALPSFMAGLRVVIVQAIGLAVVAALIGGGGLGTFVFQGLAQYATDLVLLGSGAVILLAIAADLLLQTLAAATRPRLSA